MKVDAHAHARYRRILHLGGRESDTAIAGKLHADPTPQDRERGVAMIDPGAVGVQAMAETEVITPTGKLRGVVRDGIRIFRGIRYGERVNPNRFSELRDPIQASNAPVSAFPQAPTHP